MHNGSRVGPSHAPPRQWLLLWLFLLATHASQGQLSVDTAMNAEALVDQVLVGRGIRVGNVRYKGDPRALGRYQAPPNPLNVTRGVMLSTGSAMDAVGPNDTPAQTTQLLMPKRFKGDRDLNRLTRGLRTTDVTTVEFDFIALDNMVEFQYVFASEEYKEYVGSRYNDVFGFFISGPDRMKQNVAMVPNSIAAVAINNVNHLRDKEYFVDNDPFVNIALGKNIPEKPRTTAWQRLKAKLFSKPVVVNDTVLYYVKGGLASGLDPALLKGFQYDAFTRLLKARFEVTPYTVYHIKLAIGDVGDSSFDSGVFLQEKSFIAYRDTAQVGFKPYTDQSATFDFDSAFGKQQLVAKPADSALVDPSFVLTTVYFSSGSFAIPDSAIATLNALAQQLAAHPAYTLALTGFTDGSGDEKSNRALSEKRAAAIMQHLIRQGIDGGRLSYEGRAATEPVGDDRTPQGRALNRRVEMELERE